MSRNGGGPVNHDAFTYVAMVLLAVVFAVIAWAVIRDPFLILYRGLRIGEAAVLGLFDPKAAQIRDWLLVHPASSLTMEHVKLLAEDIGKPWRWLTVVTCVGCAAGMMMGRSDGKISRSFTLKSFIEAQAAQFPILTPLLHSSPEGQARAPGSVPVEVEGTWEEALQPHEWAAYHGVLVRDGVVDQAAAAARFAAQLGPAWAGAAGLPRHVTAFMAVLALHGAQKRDEARALAGEIAQCWRPRRGLVLPSRLAKRIGRVLADPAIGEPALALAAEHHFRHSALYRVITWARERGGNLASSNFIWLRLEDRTLWYVLNGVGRKPCWAEAAGVRAHFDAEMLPLRLAEVRRRRAKDATGSSSPEVSAQGDAPALRAHPLDEPAVEAAVAALQEWITQVKPDIPRGRGAAAKAA